MGKIKERDILVNQTTTHWAKALIKMNSSSVVVHGAENLPKDTAVVFISNHQGNYDIPILMGYIDKPKFFIAKIEVLKLPLIRSWMKYMQCVFMDRKDIRQSLQTINLGVENVKKGYSALIFPEGTRSKGGPVADFKPGSFKLATKAGVPIVPITISGSYKLMEQQGMIMKPGVVDLYIHPPIETSHLTKEELNGLSDKVREIIIRVM